MKYFAFYDTAIGRRPMNLAAVNKVDYISSAIKRSGVPVEIISCSMEAPQRIKACVERNSNGINVRYLTAHKLGKTKIKRFLQVKARSLRLFFYLLSATNKDDTLLVYHSLYIMNSVFWAKKIKHFKLVLETEEIYNDVFLRSKRSEKQEYRIFSAADAYVFPTRILAEKVNTANKPDVIIHGNYNCPKSNAVKNTDKINVIYSGSFDPNKGGLKAALDSALFLPQNYVLHVLGKGSDDMEKYVNDFIAEHSEKDACKIIFGGLLHGQDYIDYLSTCDIGLSTQNPSAKFNDTSFPSKVLTYMSCNLRVVSAHVRVVETSAVGEYIHYYDNQDGKSIAAAVTAVDMNDGYNSIEIVEKLDAQFLNDISKLF